MPRAAGPGWRGAFYSKETGHTEFDSFVRGYAGHAGLRLLRLLRVQAYDGNRWPRTDNVVASGIYDTELEQRAVFGEVGFDVTENFTITAGGRWFEYDRKFDLHQESPAGFSGVLVHRRDTRRHGRQRIGRAS